MKARIKIEMAAAETGRGGLRKAVEFSLQRGKMRKVLSSDKEVKVQFHEMEFMELFISLQKPPYKYI